MCKKLQLCDAGSGTEALHSAELPKSVRRRQSSQVTMAKLARLISLARVM